MALLPLQLLLVARWPQDAGMAPARQPRVGGGLCGRLRVSTSLPPGRPRAAQRPRAPGGAGWTPVMSGSPLSATPGGQRAVKNALPPTPAPVTHW